MDQKFLKTHAEKHLNKLVQLQPIRSLSESSPHLKQHDFISRQILTSRHNYNYNFKTSRSKKSKPQIDNQNKQNLNITTLPYQVVQRSTNFPNPDLKIPATKNIRLA